MSRIKWKSAFKMCKMYRFRSSCICAKYHPSLCSPFIHSVVPNDSISGQRRPWSLRRCVGWNGPSLSAYAGRQVFAWCSLYLCLFSDAKLFQLHRLKDPSSLFANDIFFLYKKKNCSCFHGNQFLCTYPHSCFTVLRIRLVWYVR